MAPTNKSDYDERSEVKRLLMTAAAVAAFTAQAVPALSAEGLSGATAHSGGGKVSANTKPATSNGEELEAARKARTGMRRGPDGSLRPRALTPA